MQAITTRMHPATNHKPHRISATAAAGRRYYSVCSFKEERIGSRAVHRAAAQRYVENLGWGGGWTGGGLPNGDMVWTCSAGYLDDTFDAVGEGSVDGGSAADQASNLAYDFDLGNRNGLARVLRTMSGPRAAAVAFYLRGNMRRDCDISRVGRDLMDDLPVLAEGKGVAS